MNSPGSHRTVLSEESGRREKAKERLYVIFQTGGWLAFLGMQLTFPFGFSQQKVSFDEGLTNTAVFVWVLTLAWLTTHFTRVLIKRWNWKELGWRALLPRIFAISLVQSAFWVTTGFGYLYGLLDLPWTAKQPLPLVIVANVIYGVVMFSGWLCLYFFYHLFDRFNRSELERVQLSAAVKEAELRSLKSQINPHFRKIARTAVRDPRFPQLRSKFSRP